MAKKGTDPKILLLEKLPLLLSGPLIPKNVWGGGAAGKALHAAAEAEGYVTLVTLEVPPAAGKKGKPKSVEHLQLTEKGRHWLLETLSPKPALEAIAANVRNLLTAAETLGQELELQAKAQAERVLGLQTAVTALHEQLPAIAARAVAASTVPPAASPASPPPPPPAQFVAPVVPPGAPPSVPPGPDLAKVVINKAREYRQVHHEDIPLPELHAHLRILNPNMTIGEFHDIVRKIDRAGQATLVHWAGPLDRAPDLEKAICYKSHVMYYLSLPNV